jgi:hypothetical protein
MRSLRLVPGCKISWLSIQIVTKIYREQFGQIIDRIEALEAYARTYTRKPSFHRAATERNTKHLYEKLKQTPLRLGQNLAIEIIPYEVLWDEILTLLENKFRAKTAKKINLQK